MAVLSTKSSILHFIYLLSFIIDDRWVMVEVSNDELNELNFKADDQVLMPSTNHV